MPKYQTVIVCDVEAADYEDAVEKTKNYLQTVHGGKVIETCACLGIEICVEENFEHDNEGNRVLYLHPEDIDLDRYENWPDV